MSLKASSSTEIIASDRNQQTLMPMNNRSVEKNNIFGVDFLVSGCLVIPGWVKDEPGSGERKPDWCVHVYTFYEVE